VRRAAALVLAAAVAAPESAAAAPDARLARVGTFRSPVFVTAPPGDERRLLVVERSGRIRVVRDGRPLRRPFLDIRRSVLSSYEQGLLSLAFAPDYATSGRFYVYFSNRSGDIRLREYGRSAASEDQADPGSGRTVLAIPHRRYANHYGGQLQFGPDGLLYVSTGDGGGSGNPLGTAQRRSSLLGKILRIDPRRRGSRPYSVPGSNPFHGGGARREVYAYGLRNPWRFSFDRETGAIAIGDVGQDHVEEIDFAPRGGAGGANFGWNRFEGRRRFRGGGAPGHRPPVLEKSHAAGWCSIIGGYVVRDPQLPALAGRYVYGDFCRSELRSVELRPAGAGGDRGSGVRVPGLSSFGEDALGRVYAASLEGPVYRLEPAD
jgi:glucose/arabinose dehydrogenase